MRILVARFFEGPNWHAKLSGCSAMWSQIVTALETHIQNQMVDVELFKVPNWRLEHLAVSWNGALP